MTHAYIANRYVNRLDNSSSIILMKSNEINWQSSNFIIEFYIIKLIKAKEINNQQNLNMFSIV